MNALSDRKLEGMLADLESDLAERKESLLGDSPTKIRQTICAFANDLPDHRKPGVVFVGAKDDGSPSGVPITDELLKQLADMKTDGNILPPPSMAVQKRTLLGSEMAIVLVEPADSPPVRYKGRIYIRIGPRRGIATAQDERILSEKRRHKDIPFDIQSIPSATLKDLDQSIFEKEYLPSAFASDILAANDRTYEQMLAALKMISSIEDAVPTILGVLVLGIRPRDYLPGAYIQFLRVEGTKYSDPVVDELGIDGPVGETLRWIDDKLKSHNRVAVDFKTSSTETRTQPYPLVALQQIVRNAVMHRTYESTNAPVHVYWFDDRIEVMSPGGPYGIVTSENFGEPGVVDYRNPNLAEALRVLGFVQRFGFGLQTARDELDRNGNPPMKIEASPNRVLVQIGAKP